MTFYFTYTLCYVDYDQFEVGIMAALSSDENMKYIYENSDAYKDLASQVFNNEQMRKKAKVLFLSFTYGMSLENILGSVAQLGGDQKIARKYFSGFSEFEIWKESIHKEFKETQRIRTISANYLNRSSDSELTEKEIEVILYLNETKTKHDVSDLQKNIWGYSLDIETHTVETHIYRLRKKIKDKFNDGEFIISHNEGYLI
jgi:hypothetical protein